MELRVAGVAQGTPPGWRRWRATDRSLSFVAPVPDEPVEASFDGDLWEVTIEGSLMDFYIYASDTYLDVGSDALPQLHEIADGVVAAGTSCVGLSSIGTAWTGSRWCTRTSRAATCM